MKKLAIGCVVILALGMVGVGVASYAAYRKVSSAFAGFAELGSLPELERSIRNQRPFAPPANGEPNLAQIEHLVEVQGAVRTRLGARAEEMDRRYERLLEKDRATAVDAPQIISAYRDLAAPERLGGIRVGDRHDHLGSETGLGGHPGTIAALSVPLQTGTPATGGNEEVPCSTRV